MPASLTTQPTQILLHLFLIELSKEGTWGGEECIKAAADVTSTIITIHQENESPFSSDSDSDHDSDSDRDSDSEIVIVVVIVIVR